MIDGLHRYIESVQSGTVPTCEQVQQSVARHLADLEKGDEFPFYFSEKHATAAVNFFRILKHTKGTYAGKPFYLQDSQVFILSVLFGWRRKSDNCRRFRKGYIEVARKNGKSELAAGILLYCLIMDEEMVGENYSAATTRDQAKIVFKSAKIMAQYLRKDSKQMARDIEILAHSILYKPTGGHIQALSADAGTLDGLNPQCAVIDEYHEHKNSDVLQVIQTGMGSRSQPLVVVITTAGFNQASPCYTEERKVATDVLAGRIEENTLFAIIYTVDDGDKWDDPDVWVKSNPHLGVTPTIDYMEAALKEAKNKGGRYITQFLTKNLNVWTDAPDVWIPDDNWRLNEIPFDVESLDGQMCYGGLDLASVSDLTSLCLFFPTAGPDGRHVLLWYNWLPEETVEKRSGKVNYPLWVDKGWISTTAGNAADYDQIRHDIVEAASKYQIHSVQYDRWNSTDLIPRLSDEGLDMQPFGQGYGSMSTPSKYFEKLILKGECTTGGNPVARWANGNVVIDTNPAGDIKPNKSKASEKIDPIVSAIMAVGGWLIHTNERGQSSYLFEDDSELIII